MAQAARTRKYGPPAVLDDLETEELFLQNLDNSGGNLTAAAASIGVNREVVYRRMRRLPDFGERVQAIQYQGRRRRASIMLERVDAHVESILREGLVPMVDERGDPVLDDDLEQRMVSVLSPKAVVDIRKELRQSADGESPLVALQINNDRAARTSFVNGEEIDVEALLARHESERIIEAEFEEAEDVP